MSKTAQALQANIDQGRPNLIGYFPLGYPTLEASVEVAIEMCRSGIDVLELGIPYSDPVMDGIVIQEATQQALEQGFKLSQTFAALKKITSAVDTPVLVMSYWNPILQFGVEKFAVEIRNAGGVVTEDEIRSLAISQRLLGTKEIILIHHTDCGMLTFTDDGFKASIHEELGVKPAWAAEAFSDLDTDVKQSINRIKQSPFIPHKDSVRGFVFDVATGRLREVVAN
jgi:hypothetical protein